MKIELTQIFTTIINNIYDDNILDDNINIIYNNFFDIEYNLLIQNIINLLDNTNFIFFLDKLLDKLDIYKKSIITDIIKNVSDIQKLKNLFILKNITYILLLNIYLLKNKDVEYFTEILEWICEIGKIFDYHGSFRHLI